MELDPEQILEALVKKAEAGELPPKKANMLIHLKQRVAGGAALTEMQVELLETAAVEYGICDAGPA
jgi:hypothetical protein